MVAEDPRAAVAPRVVYRHAVESFIKFVIDRRGLRTDDFVSSLRAQGLSLDARGDLELERMDLLVELTAARFGPGRPRDEVLEEMGREQLRGFAESLVGRSLFFVLRRFGVRRSMLRTAENFRTVANCTSVDTRELGPTHLELTFRPLSRQPAFLRGVLGESMRVLGAPRFTLEHEVVPEGDRYTLRW
ncbi:MAG: DUF2378 family protein [Myxococcota bacterium]